MTFDTKSFAEKFDQSKKITDCFLRSLKEFGYKYDDVFPDDYDNSIVFMGLPVGETDIPTEISDFIFNRGFSIIIGKNKFYQTVYKIVRHDNFIPTEKIENMVHFATWYAPNQLKKSLEKHIDMEIFGDSYEWDAFERTLIVHTDLKEGPRIVETDSFVKKLRKMGFDSIRVTWDKRTKSYIICYIQ